MGAYGSPELGPYNENDRRFQMSKQECKNQAVANGWMYLLGYVSTFELVLHIILGLLFIMMFFFGGGNVVSFCTALFFVEFISVVAHVIVLIICEVKKIRNNLYKLKLFEAIILVLVMPFILGTITNMKI